MLRKRLVVLLLVVVAGVLVASTWAASAGASPGSQPCQSSDNLGFTHPGWCVSEFNTNSFVPAEVHICQQRAVEAAAPPSVGECRHTP